MMITTMLAAAAAAAAAPQWVPLNGSQAQQAQAQTSSAQQTPAVPAVARFLPAATMVSLTSLQELSSKHIRQGERYQFAVVNDVTEKGVVVIPRGSIATGVISMKTGRAVGGKSGKFDVTFESVTANGVRFPLSGVYHQEGKGNTLGALFGSIIISGHSAVLQPGQVLTAFTSDRTAY
jgi:hypothetical protein